MRSEVPEARERRLVRQRTYQTQRRASESLEEKTARLTAQRERHRQRWENDPEYVEYRRRLRREYQRRLRANPKYRDADNKRRRDWIQRKKAQDPEFLRKRGSRERLRQYGISRDQEKQMLTCQGNKCAICRTDTPGGNGTWHIDHCHETGKIRGLLCRKCNGALGMFNDNIDSMLNAIAYLMED